MLFLKDLHQPRPIVNDEPGLVFEQEDAEAASMAEEEVGMNLVSGKGHGWGAF